MDTEDYLEKLFDEQIKHYKKNAKAKFVKGMANRVIKTANYIDYPYIPEGV